MPTKADRKAQRRKQRRENKKKNARSKESPPVPPDSSAPHQTVKADEAGDGAKAANKLGTGKDHDEALARYAGYQVVFSACLVFFAIVQSWVGGCQWDATNKQWSVMVQDQRPWLGPKEVTDSPPVIGQPILRVLTFSNTGKTPAVVENLLLADIFFEVKGKFSSQSEDDSTVDRMINQAIAMVQPDKTETIVAPGAGLKLGLTRPGKPIDENLFNALKAGTTRYYVSATVGYSGPNGLSGETRINYRYDPDAGLFVSLGRGDYMK